MSEFLMNVINVMMININNILFYLSSYFLAQDESGLFINMNIVEMHTTRESFSLRLVHTRFQENTSYTILDRELDGTPAIGLQHGSCAPLIIRQHVGSCSVPNNLLFCCHDKTL
ncbi:unnamed protein product [Amoebophrya sp. A25]|nr:unnamed protein product [Amoebophrya sp. A25]|eukprot:GSA25T00018041001.1